MNCRVMHALLRSRSLLSMPILPHNYLHSIELPAISERYSLSTSSSTCVSAGCSCDSPYSDDVRLHLIMSRHFSTTPTERYISSGVSSSVSVSVPVLVPGPAAQRGIGT